MSASNAREKFSLGGSGEPGIATKAATAVAQTAAQAVQAVSDAAQGAGLASPSKPVCTGGDPRKQGPQLPFPPQTQTAPGKQSEMSPQPDYGYETYKGRGKLTDKIALVTGADSGIGRAVALAFAREGADIAIGYLNEHEDAEETKRIVHEAGRRAVLLPGDLSTEGGCKSLVQRVVDEFGRIDILVNNAGWQGKTISDITEIDRERLEYTYRLNVFAPFTLTAAAQPHMPPGACIINVASDEAYGPQFMLLDYATTKAAITAFTKGAAQKIISDHGIRINCVAPGPCWTPLIPISFPTTTSTIMGKGITPIGRAAQPAEIAPAFVYLASDDASYVNGSILAVTGGMFTN